MFENNGADFSDCGQYRYSLWRIWDVSKPLVMFIGLNPSTANANTDDPTIRRVKAIANNLGYGGIYMCNCFPYISTDPKKLIDVPASAMLLNGQMISRLYAQCVDVIFAWGNFDIVANKGIDKALSEVFPEAKALHINKNGTPKHPLYCKTDIVPVLYKNDNK